MNNPNEIINKLQLLFDNILKQINFHDSIQNLKNILDQYYADDIISNMVLSSENITNFIPLIQQNIEKYEKLNELNLIIKSFSDSSFANNYLHPDGLGVMQEEGDKLKLNKNSTILILGSGFYPVTAIYYNRLFKCKCICVDYDPKVVVLSREFISSLNLENDIIIQKGNAINYAIKNIDVIFITTCCVPKNKIFINILNSNSNVLVAFRNPIGLYKIWYPETMHSDYKNFKLIDESKWEKRYPISLKIVSKIL